MLIVWTTVATIAEAENLAAAAVAQGLAACVQITACVSHYRWLGKAERADEQRLSFKCLAAQLADLEAFVLGRHSYAVPEWVVVRAEHVSEKYLSWAASNSTNRPL